MSTSGILEGALIRLHDSASGTFGLMRFIRGNDQTQLDIPEGVLPAMEISVDDGNTFPLRLGASDSSSAQVGYIGADSVLSVKAVDLLNLLCDGEIVISSNLAMNLFAEQSMELVTEGGMTLDSPVLTLYSDNLNLVSNSSSQLSISSQGSIGIGSQDGTFHNGNPITVKCVEEFTNKTRVTVNHDFGDSEIVVQVIDSSGLLIKPSTIGFDHNEFTVQLPQPRSGKVIYIV